MPLEYIDSLIDKTLCLGNTLSTININFSSLDTSLAELSVYTTNSVNFLSTTLEKVSASLQTDIYYVSANLINLSSEVLSISSHLLTEIHYVSSNIFNDYLKYSPSLREIRWPYDHENASTLQSYTVSITGDASSFTANSIGGITIHVGPSANSMIQAYQPEGHWFLGIDANGIDWSVPFVLMLSFSFEPTAILDNTIIRWKFGHNTTTNNYGDLSYLGVQFRIEISSGLDAYIHYGAHDGSTLNESPPIPIDGTLRHDLLIKGYGNSMVDFFLDNNLQATLTGPSINYGGWASYVIESDVGTVSDHLWAHFSPLKAGFFINQ